MPAVRKRASVTSRLKTRGETMVIPSHRDSSKFGFVNRWPGVRFPHPAPLPNKNRCDGADATCASRRCESDESSESNVVLPYRKSGHNDPRDHLLDQRSEIGPRLARNDGKSPEQDCFLAASEERAGSQKWSHDLERVR